jgi:DNA-binding transcriptional ArsR family regulator
MPRPKRADQLHDAVDTGAVVDIARVRAARAALPGAEATQALAALFAALGDPTRLRVVAALAASELCVGDIAGALGLSESAASHQLRVLRSLGLARARREGRLVYYTLDDEHVVTLYRQGLEHVGHAEQEDR